jgi:hypothetical protein
MKRLIFLAITLSLTTMLFLEPGLALPTLPHKVPIADLVVTGVTFDPPQPRAQKDMITIRVTVKNIGTKAVPKITSLSMGVYSVDANGERDGQDNIPKAIPWYTNNIPALAAGAQVVISKTVTLNHIGRHMVDGVIITEGLQVGDEKPGNNNYKVFFMAGPPPPLSDLVLDEVSRTAEGRIKIKMHNGGYAIPDVDREISYVKITINGALEKSYFLRDIDPNKLLSIGESPPWTGLNRIYLSFIWPATGQKGIQLQPGQSYTVKVVLDYNSRISDSNGSNNVKTVTL